MPPRALPDRPRKSGTRVRFSSSRGVSLPGLRIEIIEGDPLQFFLSGPVVLQAGRPGSRLELINRLFAIPSLKSLRLEWRKGRVRLEFGVVSVREALETLARVMQEGPAPARAFPLENLVGGVAAPPLFDVHRNGTGLTLWRIDAPTNRLFFLSHPLLRSERIRKEILAELATLSDGVQRALPFGDAILVFVRPYRFEASFFPEILDAVLVRCLTGRQDDLGSKVEGALVNANLALSPVADFVFPPVGVVNAALTGFLSHRYVPDATVALRQGRFSLDFLNLVIAGLSVITYEFFPAALMGWLMRFWPEKARRIYDSHHARFLARYRHRPHRVWVEREGAVLETPVEKLLPAHVVTLAAGDVVPGDGLIVGGSARINEQLLTGVRGTVAKSEGSPIYAATRVVDGSVQIQVNALGEKTAAAKLARRLSQTLHRQGGGKASRAQAERAVAPALLAGGLALLPGGLNAAKSVLRPDYLTGPALAEGMTGLATVMRAAHEGILLGGRSDVQTLLSADCIIFDDSVPWEISSRTREPFARIASGQGVRKTAFFTQLSGREGAELAVRLGFPSFFGSSTEESKLAYISSLREAGESVVYVGDHDVEPAVAAAANLAVSVLQPPYETRRDAPLALLAPDLLKFLQLRALSADLLQESRTAFGISLVPNLAAVLGAIFLRSPVLVSVLLTNLGTMANYVRATALLQLAERELEA